MLSCSVCLYPDKSTTWSMVPCGHVFHRDCISSWRDSQKSPITECPQCRKTFSETTQIYPQIENESSVPNELKPKSAGSVQNKEIEEERQAVISALQFELSEVMAKSSQHEIWWQVEKQEHAETKSTVVLKELELNESKRELELKKNELCKIKVEMQNLKNETNKTIADMETKIKNTQDARQKKAKLVAELMKQKRSLERCLLEKDVVLREKTKMVTRLEKEVHWWKKTFKGSKLKLGDEGRSTKWLFPPKSLEVTQTPISSKRKVSTDVKIRSPGPKRFGTSKFCLTSRAGALLDRESSAGKRRVDQSDSHTSPVKRPRTLKAFVDERPLSSILNNP